MISSDSVTKYAQDVVNKKIIACRYVQLACQRHLDDLEKDWQYTFKPELAERFFKFCTYLKHYKGAFQGKSFELMDWQKFVFGSIYGWVNKTNDIWRFKAVYIEVPRKNGKTTLASACALYDSAFIEKTGAEIYAVATKEDQAKLLYGDCKAYINQSAELENIFEILTGRSILYVKGSARTSFIKPLGSDSKRLDGLNPLAVYADELHAWQKRELWDVMEDAFGARQQYRILSITTAGYDRQGVCYKEREHLVRILEKQIESEEKFGIIYTVNDEDEENWSDERVWKMANPSLGEAKELAYMKTQVEKVKQVPSRLNSFLNKQLNIWTDVEQAWISTADWRNCENKINEKDLIGKICYAGMDLARVNDLSACAYLFPIQEGIDKITLLVDFFVPDFELNAREVRDQVPYSIWAEENNLILTNGKTTNWDFIKKSIIDRNGQFAIKSFGYDRHFAGELIQALDSENINMQGFGMGFVSMASPTAEMERLVVGKDIQHSGCPILSWNFSNVIVATDPAGNLKPDKMRSVDRIDGAVASIIALGMKLIDEQEEKIDPYANRGLRML